MSENLNCPVKRAIGTFTEAFTAGTVLDPELLRHMADLLRLLEEIAAGKGSIGHVVHMETLAGDLAVSNKAAAAALGQGLLDTLGSEGEVFQSHIESHICLSGECARLTPAPCQMACPAGIDVASYVSLIGWGRYAEAVDLIRRDNPFPWVCGLICDHPCETECTRQRLDLPVAIRDLKAFAARQTISSDSWQPDQDPLPPNGKRVAIMGAGPAGLSAAYHLALKGYAVTVFEKLPVAGGMMAVGIPAYRLPRELVATEIQLIQRLGVVIRTGVTFGEDVTLEQLRADGYGAFFVATGLHFSGRLNVPGEELPGVLKGVEFLRDVSLGRRVVLGRRVIVIGGGNVAIDVARSALRVGAKAVSLVCLEQRCEMPAWEEEIKEALEEGIGVTNCFGPRRFMEENGRVAGLEFKHCLSVFDENHRFNPCYDECVLNFIEADNVIVAIGQGADTGFANREGILLTPRGGLVADAVTHQTPVADVFAGGDAAYGPRSVIEAIGAGKSAARSIHFYLKGLALPRNTAVPVRRMRTDCFPLPAERKMRLVRPRPASVDPDVRCRTFERLDGDLSDIQARDEALRCLRCDICKRCGQCADICREKMGLDALPFNHFVSQESPAGDYRVTADRCVLCGACTENCPTGAMRLERCNGDCQLVFCGTMLCQDQLEYCEACGAELGTTRYLDHVFQRMQGMDPSPPHRPRLCAACVRSDLKGRYLDHVPQTVPG
jgi:NADPH-dependent glutamate synthase beta subunit-like oxidoreductase